MMKSKIKIFPIILVFLFLFNSILSQTQVDSLKGLIHKSEGKQKLKLLIEVGYFLSSENPKEAIEYLDEAILLADKINSRWSKADAVFNKGVALWHLGEIAESDKYYEDAIKIYEEFNDSLSLIKVFNSQAINYQIRGNIDLAFETFLKSLDYARKVGDKTTIFNTLLNIGIMYDNIKDFDNCLKYYYEAMQYADEIDKASLALLQSYIAEVYLTLKDNEKAEEYLQKAIENSNLSGDTKSLIWAYSSLGYIQLDRKNFDKAENYFLESLKLARYIDYKLEIIHSLTDLGKFYNQTNNLSLAEKYLSEAFSLSEELKSLSDLSIVYKELSLLNAKNKNYKKAFEYHEKYKEYSDSLFIISNTEKFVELQTKHELKQKERETELLIHENELQKKIINSQKIIALVISLLAIASIIFIWALLRNRSKILKAKNLLQIKNDEIENNRSEISEKNEVLAGLNATKDKFFSIIAHDLRNPIAAFVSISELLELDYDRISDKDKREIISQMNSSSKNLIRLLENLLTWARLSNNKIEVYPESLLMKDILESSIHPYLQSAQNKKIKIMVDVPDVLVIETDIFITQTIVGNLINNAIKFSNQHSEINVSLTSTNISHKLVIKDNGIGIEESQLRNIFVLGKISSGRGTMGEGGTGLGLILVKELIEKLNWKIEVKSKVNAGTEFIISIPK
jgi:signal transduction histidine kinase/Tfp pilus assembly protein PilF